MHETCSENIDHSGASSSIIDNCPLCRAPRVGEYSPEMILLFQKWADLGKMWAYHQLGVAYSTGRGVEQSTAIALQHLETASAGGYRMASTILGTMYHKGEAVEQSHARAKLYFEMAASQGDDVAQLSLARMYINGWGVEKNHEEANRLLQLSADQGHPFACFSLGIKILSGENIRMSTFRASHYLSKVKVSDVGPKLGGHSAKMLKDLLKLMVSQRGAANGVATQQFNLASAYANGQAGVKKSLPAANFWYTKAVAQGFGQAIPMLALLTTMMEKSEEKTLPEDTLFCSTCASLEPRRVPPIKKSGFLTCTCKKALYCSKECQKEGWREHAKVHKIALMEKRKEK